MDLYFPGLEVILQTGFRGQHSEVSNLRKALLKQMCPKDLSKGLSCVSVYINDIIKAFDCSIKLFADGTTLYIDSEDHSTADYNLNLIFFQHQCVGEHFVGKL